MPQDPVREAGILEVFPADIVERLGTIGSPHAVDLHDDEAQFRQGREALARSVSGYPIPRDGGERSIYTNSVEWVTILVCSCPIHGCQNAGGRSWKIDARITVCGTPSRAARSPWRRAMLCPKTTWCSSCWTPFPRWISRPFTSITRRSCVASRLTTSR